MNICVFCEEISGSPQSVWHQLRGDLPSKRYLYEDDLWLVMPPLGCFCAGGLLFVTRRHVTSCAELTHDEAILLDDLIHIVNSKASAILGMNYVFFEHGPSHGKTKGACCVDHAHINAFPVSYSILGDIPDFQPKYATSSISELRQVKGREYLWISEGNSNGHLQIVDEVPSQYIRTIITQKMMCPERWHWLDYLGLEEIKSTMNLLGGIFV